MLQYKITMRLISVFAIAIFGLNIHPYPMLAILIATLLMTLSIIFDLTFLANVVYLISFTYIALMVCFFMFHVFAFGFFGFNYSNEDPIDFLYLSLPFALSIFILMVVDNIYSDKHRKKVLQ